MKIIDRRHGYKIPNWILNLFWLRIRLEWKELETGLLMMYGDLLQLINVLQMAFMVVQEHLMGFITSILLWAQNLQLFNHFLSNTAESKSRPNFQKEIGSGPQSGSYQDIINMELGQLVVKSISWKVEVMLDIHNQLVEDHNHLDQLYIGVLIGQRTSLKKLTLSTLILQELWLMISIHMVSIGMTNNFIPTSMMIQKKFFKSIILILLIGKKQDSVEEIIHGNILPTSVLHLILNFIWSLIWPSEELTDISLMELLESHGLTDHKEHQVNFMTTKEHGSTLGAKTVFSKLKVSRFGI